MNHSPVNGEKRMVATKVPKMCALRLFFRNSLAIRPAWERSQNPPRLKKSKKSLRASLRRSLRGSRPTPQRESKTSLLETLRVKNHQLLTPRDLFLTLFGVGRDPRRLCRKLARRLLFDFLSRGMS